MADSRGMGVGDVELRFKRYPKYRDSGVEWLGEIPANWEVWRLRDTVRSCQTGIWGDDPTGDDDLVCVRVADFDRATLTVGLHKPTLRTINPLVRDRYSLQSGDLLLEKSGSGDRQPVGVVVLFSWKGSAVCSNFIARMTVRDSHHCPSFLTYLHHWLYQAGINRRSIKQSTEIQNLDSRSYLNEKVGLPKIEEQRMIAAFLDLETERIDDLVRKKQRLVELLREKREALISHAVTMGLDPDPPMKDTGIEWLGAIPAHWDVRRLKMFSDVQISNVDNKSVAGQVAVRLCNYTDVYYRDEIGANLELMEATATEDQARRFSLRQGHVLITKDSETPDDIAVPSVVADDLPRVVCGYHLAHVKPDDRCDGRYLKRAFESVGPRDQFQIVANGVTRFGLTGNAIGCSVFPLPPRTEQIWIADYLDHETRKLEALIEKIGYAIDHLLGYRSAVISAAVTGKLDVRERSISPSRGATERVGDTCGESSQSEETCVY